MAKHFNELTAAQLERLAILSEEAGEIVQAVGKILRHGYESHHPDGGPNNREALEQEIGDLLYLVDLLFATGDLNEERVREARESKAESMAPYLHHRQPRLRGEEPTTP